MKLRLTVPELYRPTVVYGCESSVLNKNAQKHLRRWLKKIIRKILGGMKRREQRGQHIEEGGRTKGGIHKENKGVGTQCLQLDVLVSSG